MSNGLQMPKVKIRLEEGPGKFSSQPVNLCKRQMQGTLRIGVRTHLSSPFAGSDSVTPHMHLKATGKSSERHEHAARTIMR